MSEADEEEEELVWCEGCEEWVKHAFVVPVEDEEGTILLCEDCIEVGEDLQ